MPSQHISFSRLTSVQPAIKYFEKRGVPVQKYLRQAGISDRLLADLETPVPKNMQWEFVSAACDGEDIDEIGILVGKSASLEDLGEYGQLLLGSGTIGKYLENGCRSINTLSSGEYYWLLEEVDQLRFCVSVSGSQKNHTIQIYLYALLITINTIRKATDASWCPAEINVPAMKVRSAAELAKILPDTKISRRGHYASFSIPYSFLEKPLTKGSSSPTLLEASLPPDFKSSVVETIKILIFSRRTGLKNLVELSGISSRTLQRKFKNMGVSYTDLVVEARIDIAKQWLENGDMSITDVSRALGYQNPSNFGRAFRRLVGQSPSAFKSRANKSALPASQIEKFQSQSK